MNNFADDKLWSLHHDLELNRLLCYLFGKRPSYFLLLKCINNFLSPLFKTKWQAYIETAKTVLSRLLTRSYHAKSRILVESSIVLWQDIAVSAVLPMVWYAIIAELFQLLSFSYAHTMLSITRWSTASHQNHTHDNNQSCVLTTSALHGRSIAPRSSDRR